MSAELFDAIEQHDAKRVDGLLAGGADPNAHHPQQPVWHVLMTAIEELSGGGSIESVEVLIRAGASVNAADPLRDGIPLLVAVLNKQVEAAGLLLDAGAEPCVVDGEGDSPLWRSVELKDHDMVALLLAHGAAKAMYRVDPFSGMNALGRAVWNLDAPMVELLLAAGADPERIDLDYETAWDRLPPRDTSDPQVWDAVSTLLEDTAREKQVP